MLVHLARHGDTFLWIEWKTRILLNWTAKALIHIRSWDLHVWCSSQTHSHHGLTQLIHGLDLSENEQLETLRGCSDVMVFWYKNDLFDLYLYYMLVNKFTQMQSKKRIKHISKSMRWLISEPRKTNETKSNIQKKYVHQCSVFTSLKVGGRSSAVNMFWWSNQNI